MANEAMVADCCPIKLSDDLPQLQAGSFSSGSCIFDESNI